MGSSNLPLYISISSRGRRAFSSPPLGTSFDFSHQARFPPSVYANTGKNEYDRNPRDSGYPYLLFLGKRDPIPGTDSFFLDFPPSNRETLEPWKSWNEKAKGERKRRRREGRGGEKRNFVLPSSSFPSLLTNVDTNVGIPRVS